ncbi:hypothetical protein Ancab_011925 [Ancistrocladus abbreviatus]
MTCSTLGSALAARDLAADPYLRTSLNEGLSIWALREEGWIEGQLTTKAKWKIYGARDWKFMATATMATAAGAAALLYYTLNRKLRVRRIKGEEDENGREDNNNGPLGIERVSHRLIQAPATWLETISTLSETLRFTYSETLGKWPIGDLAFGINFLLKRQGNLNVESVFGGEDSVQLKGTEIAVELKYLLNLLTLCWHFSKKPFPIIFGGDWLHPKKMFFFRNLKLEF